MDPITFDELGFGTDERRITWGEIVAVGIRTTATGPYAEDVFWMFVLRDGVVELPHALVSGELLSALHQHLPGTDSQKIVKAMGSTNERVFRIWHRCDSPRRWNDEVFEARFVALIDRLGGSAAGAGEAFARLRARWGAEMRSHHNLEHLADCLRELDDAEAEPAIDDVAELALWYHDAVYEPRRRDSEEKSAQLLLADGAALQIPDAIALEAAGIVRTTAHFGSAPQGFTADLVNDIDLSILGSDALRFLDFEHSVAEEYAFVPSWVFLYRRGKLLASLLERPFIFRTERFRNSREAAARANLAALLQSPRYRVYRWLRPRSSGRG